MIVRLIIQTVVLALQQIWANKVRAILTTLGIIISVFAVVVVVAAMTGGRQYMLDQFASLGANKVWIFPNRPREMRDRYTWRQIRITQAQADGLLVNVPSLRRISPVMQLTQSVQYGDNLKPFVPIQGIRPDWHDIEARYVTEGRPFISIDEEDRRNVCLVNDKALQELSLPTDPSGEFLLIGGRRFMIVGVVETKAASPVFGGNNDTQIEVFIPFATGMTIRPDNGIYVVGQLKAPELFEDVKAETSFYLRRVRNLRPDEPDTFGIQAIDKIISQFKQISTFLTALLAGLVSIALLVGGIGIMNIMLVSVSERTREIGLRKAVGAKPMVILVQFLIEAIVLCVVGGLVGLALGQGAVLGLRAALPDALKAAVIPMWAIALALGFSAFTGVVFGMFPAIKAARLDPIDALRHE
jgi:putative ABC transport system permease protein